MKPRLNALLEMAAQHLNNLRFRLAGELRENEAPVLSQEFVARMRALEFSEALIANWKPGFANAPLGLYSHAEIEVAPHQPPADDPPAADPLAATGPLVDPDGDVLMQDSDLEPVL